MEKVNPIKGIRSVDFKITAKGEGVVNWNGPTALASDGGVEVNNHTLPKLLGFSNLTGKVSEKGYAFKKNPKDICFKENPLYVSPNCIRHRLFIDNSFDLLHVGARDKDAQIAMLASDLGLLRGFVIPASGAMRSSPLMMGALVDQLGNGQFEVMTRSGPRKEKNDESEKSDTSFFSKTTFGETFYIGYGSINIEQLSFICLDSKFGRSAMLDATQDHVEALIEALEAYLGSIEPDLAGEKGLVTFHENYVREGSIFKVGEAGLLLSEAAIMALVDHLLDLIFNLAISQGGGYLAVDSLLVDYNDSPKMRIRDDESAINEVKEAPFATYYVAV